MISSPYGLMGLGYPVSCFQLILRTASITKYICYYFCPRKCFKFQHGSVACSCKPFSFVGEKSSTILLKVVFYFLDDELIFKDQWGGISIFNAFNVSVRTIMSNQTYVSNYIIIYEKP